MCVSKECMYVCIAHPLGVLVVDLCLLQLAALFQQGGDGPLHTGHVLLRPG